MRAGIDVLDLLATRETYERKVDLPTSASPSRRTVISGGGSIESIMDCERPQCPCSAGETA